MPRAGTRITAIGLIFCLLVLSGVMYPQTVAHAAHHAHHKAATHSTALCTWMCAAGQAQETVSFNLQIVTATVHLADGFIATRPIEVHTTALVSRGPPSFLF